MTKFQPAERMNMPGYPFAELERVATQRKAQGLPLYDLSIGDPDLPPPSFIVDAIRNSLDDSEAHVYPSSRGDASVRRSIARWFAGRFNVELDPDNQICILIGAKEGLAQLARAVVNPGDEVGVPNPAYPVYGRAGCKMVEGQERTIRLTSENGFLLNLNDAVGVKLLYLNYPNNPTGATATEPFMIELADLADSEQSMTVAYDMAYSEVAYDKPIRSMLEFTPNVVEFHSMSKMANATGYRVGFAAGDPDRINALIRAKQEMDSGVPLPFQRGLQALLDSYDGVNPPEEVVASRNIVRKRRERVIETLEQTGFEVFRSDATFYIWFRVGNDELPFITRAAGNGLLLTPGSGFGSGGRGWARISVTAPDEIIGQAVELLTKLA